MLAWATSGIAHVCVVTFKLFFLTDLNNHCEERKIELLINNNIKNIKKLT